MKEITISVEEYQMLTTAMVEADMFRNLLEEKLKNGNSIYSDEIKLLCKLYRIEVKQDA